MKKTPNDNELDLKQLFNGTDFLPEQFKNIFSDLSEEQNIAFPKELLGSIKINDVFKESQKIITQIVEYRELIMMYECAIKNIRTKFEILDTEFNVRYQRNPINFINTRLKDTRSIVEKMNRKRIPFSIENIEEHINDIAGIRVICSYIDDIYSLAEALKKQDDIQIISQKDYIASPKSNGYQSMHLIVRMPIFFNNQRRYMKAEVQIRTIAMDFWATLEHQLKYKNLSSAGEEIAVQLKECADVISETDRKMLAIRKKIEANTHEPTEAEILFEKLRKLGPPLK